MKIIRVKSNINCSNCEAKVAPLLDKHEKINSWHVDLDHPDRILTVEGDVDADEVFKTVIKAGFKTEAI